MNGLIIGKKYVLSTPVDTVITDAKYNIPLGTVKGGQQYVFQAVSDAVTVADGCTIRPFEGSNGASVGVVGGGSSSDSGGSGFTDYINFIQGDGDTFSVDVNMPNLNYIPKFASNSKLISINGLLSGTEGTNTFSYCSNLVNFDCKLDNLILAHYMFQDCKKLTTTNWMLPKLENAASMFMKCESFTSFTGNLQSLTYAVNMFSQCINLTEFKCDLPRLATGATSMFYGCTKLTSFNGDLSSLTNADRMFGNSTSYCTKLDLASVQNIATTINDLAAQGKTGSISIGMTKTIQGNTELEAALATIRSKGWTVTEMYA